MYLIAGLGNPASRYDGTRHNVGFETIDTISTDYRIALISKKHKAVYGMGMIGTQKVILAKPQTYMNLSGESVREIASFYRIPPENIVIIHDDIDLPAGQLRIREKGSAGGHNGIKSIISCLGSQNFCRIRIGIGAKPEGWDLADYVLSKCSGEDLATIKEAEKSASEAVYMMVSGETARAMTKFNKKNKKTENKDNKVGKAGKEDPGMAEAVKEGNKSESTDRTSS